MSFFEHLLFWLTIISAFCLAIQTCVFEMAVTREKRLAAQKTAKGWFVITCIFGLITAVVLAVKIMRGL